MSLENWAIGKGMDIVTDAFIDESKKYKLNFETLEYLNSIEKKLDAIILGTFEKALIYLRRGNLEKAEESLIDYVSKKVKIKIPIDIEAKKLLIKLSLLNNDYLLAAQMMYDIIENNTVLRIFLVSSRKINII